MVAAKAGMLLEKDVPLWAVVGPTASGKSQLAVEIASRLGAEIVICDAYQLREGLPILTAKPTLEQQRQVPHHLLGFFPMQHPVTAALFVQEADRVVSVLKQKKKPIVFCGGTGLYLRAFVRGLFQGPSADLAVRQQIRMRIQTEGLALLHRELAQVDSRAAERISPNDAVRIERALEVYQLTGRPISVWHEESQQQPDRHVVRRVGVDPGMDELRQRIRARVDQMIQMGVCDEVAFVQRTYGDQGNPPLGYTAVLAHVRGQLDLNQMKEQLVSQTVQYARRQRTWFRKEPGVLWFKSAEQAMLSLQDESG